MTTIYSMSMSSRASRVNQRYGSQGERLVAGVVPLSADKYHVLLIQSTQRGGWIFPKGAWKIDETTAQDAAKRKAWEKAGIICKINYDLGLTAKKREFKAPKVSYHLFEATVETQEAVWPGQHKRSRKWFTHTQARQALAARPDLLDVLDRCTMYRFSDSPTHSTFKNSPIFQDDRNVVEERVADVQRVKGKLEDIEKVIRTVVLSSRDSMPTVHFHVPNEFVQFLLEDVERDCDLGLVPTVTGTLNEAYAATVRQYLSFKWPVVEFDILDLFEEARRAHGYAELKSEGLYARITRNHKTHSPPLWDVSARGPEHMLTSFAQQLCWLIACFRSPTLPGVSYCNASAYIESQMQNAVRFVVEELPTTQDEELPTTQDEEADSASCWRYMFRNFVIVTGFPIPDRGNQKGIELPLELMIHLGRVQYPVYCFEKFALKGHSTTLVPMSETADSTQWHFECNNDQSEPMSLATIRTLCEDAKQETTLDLLFSLQKRHFLGLWEHAEIHLGTQDSNHMLIRASEAKEEVSRPVIVRELPVTFGSSGLGYFGAQIQPKFSWPRAVRAELQAEEQLLIDRIRLSERNPSILYDNEQQCG